MGITQTSKLGTLDFVGIGSDTSSIGNYVCGNHIIGAPQNEAIQLVSGNIVRDNEGFVTENTILNIGNTTATTFVFNHGCANTVNSVQVSFNFTGWTSWTWTSTTTQVTVTITGTLPAAMEILAADVKYIP